MTKSSNFVADIKVLLKFSSLKSDWDVMGTSSLNPRNNPDYQSDISTLGNVNFIHDRLSYLLYSELEAV